MTKRKKLSSALALLNNNSASEWSPTQLSVPPAAWYQPGVGVTGTLTASNWADQSGNGRDLAQGTAGNQPIVLPYTGTAYGYVPGVAANSFSTPDAPANSITGDIDLRVQVALDDWTPGATNGLIGKWNTASSYDYVMSIDVIGRPVFGYTPNGSTVRVATSNAAVGVTDGEVKWVRATYASATGKVNFYLSDDGSSWTPLGAEQSLTAGTINNGTNDLYVGQTQNSGVGNEPAKGKIYRAQIYNGINGTLAVDFNPSTFTETSTNGATATASTGEVWTLNSTGAKPAQIVKSASLLFDGTDDYLQATFTLNQPATYYLVAKQITWTDVDTILDGVTGRNSIGQSIATPKIVLYAGSAVTNDNTGLAVNTKGIITAVFNGASSLLGINAGTAATGNPGSNNAGGITLGSYNTADNYYANIQVWELLAFPAAHSAAERLLVQQYLARKYNIALA